MKKENIFYRVFGLLFPMVFYLMIQLVTVNAGYWCIIFWGRIIGKEDPLSFANSCANKNILLLNLIAALIAIPIFAHMYKKELGRGSILEKEYPWKLIGKFVWIIGFALFGLLLANYIVSFLTLFMPDFMVESYASTKGAIDNAPPLVQIMSAIVLAPAVEELIFRGIIYNRLKKMTGLMMAAVISSFMFGVFHLNWIQAPFAFVIGMLAVFIYEKYQTIFASILFHGLSNMFSILMMFWVKGNSTTTEQLSKMSMAKSLLFLILLTAFLEWMIGMIINKRVQIKEIKENEIINDYDSML